MMQARCRASDGVTHHVVEHEEGYRKISEYFYRTADKLAEQIAATYMGKQIDINGTDLNAQSEKVLGEARRMRSVGLLVSPSVVHQMRKALLLAVTTLSVALRSVSTAQSRNSLVGTWKLLSA
jgi:hypothetical protein